MKLTLTAEEFAALEDARRILGDLNTSLRQRDIPVYFTVTTARDGVPADGTVLVFNADAAVTP